mgnify:CR=1 FL=1
MKILTGIESSTAALNAERLRLEVISQNIANAHVTNTPEGGPYKRMQVVFESALAKQQNTDANGNLKPGAVQIARVEEDSSPTKLVYAPSHPDARQDGYVELPNVNIHREMVDMIAASRAYEANMTAIKFAKNMAIETLSIGKG